MQKLKEVFESISSTYLISWIKKARTLMVFLDWILDLFSHPTVSFILLIELNSTPFDRFYLFIYFLNHAGDIKNMSLMWRPRQFHNVECEFSFMVHFAFNKWSAFSWFILHPAKFRNVSLFKILWLIHLHQWFGEQHILYLKCHRRKGTGRW